MPPCRQRRLWALTTLLLLQAGYAYVPYSSLESVIEQSKEASDRFVKTIVFCENIDHAERMRQALVNANADRQALRRQAELACRHPRTGNRAVFQSGLTSTRSRIDESSHYC
ncbi:MAG: Helicase type I site-specific restriction-modification system restriction subunit [Rhodocyclaceae bacterium]|nr:MAG: Helicase type I site-specific restriction-modification system restriction subunit [Rhodocyclaceae bacterium]TND03590.1 MAG: Helicase, type I site-specific restriction-modification system restriction subunit [Rhodocyclaceae bacterium]